MKVIHLGTEIVSSFGVLDDDGNVLQNIVVKSNNAQDDPLLVRRLDQELFVNAHKILVEAKQKLQEQIEIK